MVIILWDYIKLDNWSRKQKITFKITEIPILLNILFNKCLTLCLAWVAPCF